MKKARLKGQKVVFMEFEEVRLRDEDYCDLDEFQERIPEYLKRQLDKLGIVYG